VCRVFGSVSTKPLSVRHELLEAENPLIEQSRDHDSGWGVAAYERPEGCDPIWERFPEPAFEDPHFQRATRLEARIFNVHVRRATMGGLAVENTHPFCLGNYSFSHNGTVLDYPRLVRPGTRTPGGQTDSEHLFQFLMSEYDPGDPAGSFRRAVEGAIERSPFSAVNFLFSDGERLYAYRLGIFELHWLARPGQLVVSTEKLTPERWHSVRQDVLLTLNPDDPDAPTSERLVGDAVVAKADIRPFEEGAELRGEERGRFASERAARLAAQA
jgi:predicted glutamine amidotransferase